MSGLYSDSQISVRHEERVVSPRVFSIRVLRPSHGPLLNSFDFNKKEDLMPIEALGVEHLDLTVNDLQLSLPFYAKVLEYLGFRRVTHESYIAWSNSHMGIGFRAAPPEEKSATFSRYRVGLHHLALRAKSREDVDKFYQFLTQEGITILDPPAEYPEYGPN